VSEAPEDLFFVADPVNSLFSVHGGCRDRDVAFGEGVLGEGAEGFSWRLGVGGSGQFGHSVADYLLAGGRDPGASAWASGAEAILPSGGDTSPEESRDLGGGGRLL